MRKLVKYVVLATVISGILPVFGQQGQPGKLEPAIKDLRVAHGKTLTEGSNKSPFGPRQLLTYKLEEVPLSEPIKLKIRGREKAIDNVFRLTITGGESLAAAGIIWIDDAALTGIWSHGGQKIGALISDRSILREGAEIAISNRDGSQLHSLPERLKLPDNLKTTIEPIVEAGNSIVGIHSLLRMTGSIRRRLIQIEMRTDRPFPVRNAALEVQIGRKFFRAGGADLNAGVFLTPEEFAQLKDGAEVIAFYISPDRSGAFASEIWYFGRLNKSMLDR